MNEVIIVTHTGDLFDDVINTAMEVVAIKTVSYAKVSFNGVNVFVKKDSTVDSITQEYNNRLKSLNT